ncbi:hypothetical protein VPKG_00022 [Vibrio phage pYD21-A]|uniref:hypothetical protein n=1 Tax=Vibrio phage pYD21-A TaxID=754049 RepID=UPI0002C046D0|nr:hypothetical protein VPKG_00022 [Vibrio phage pYD21-A]AGH16059.1 hypothetical protein VPKG_00022 [Vibrio phage pYD21-A]
MYSCFYGVCRTAIGVSMNNFEIDKRAKELVDQYDGSAYNLARRIFELEQGGYTLTISDSSWVSVSDKLPNEDVRVLVTHTDEVVPKTCEAKLFLGEFVEPNEEWVRYDSVTHWKPMPVPTDGAVSPFKNGCEKIEYITDSRGDRWYYDEYGNFVRED